LGPETTAPDKAQQKTIQTVRKCIEQLKSNDQIAYIIAWAVERDPVPHLDLAGYTFEAAMREIAEFLAVEVRSDLCFL
jgi:hypothetical protein